MIKTEYNLLNKASVLVSTTVENKSRKLLKKKQNWKVKKKLKKHFILSIMKTNLKVHYCRYENLPLYLSSHYTGKVYAPENKKCLPTNIQKKIEHVKKEPTL